MTRTFRKVGSKQLRVDSQTTGRSTLRIEHHASSSYNVNDRPSNPSGNVLPVTSRQRTKFHKSYDMSLTRYAAEKSTHKGDRESVKQDIDVTMSIVDEKSID